MYQLLVWWCHAVLYIAVSLAVVVFSLFGDWRTALSVPAFFVMVISAIFGGTSYWQPWRIIWRRHPSLNTILFPDLNGIWVGTTGSNWPTISKMFDAARGHYSVTENDLYETLRQTDAMAMEIKASLFKVQIVAALSSTNGFSRSVTVRPWKDNHGHLHLTYVYEQETPDPAISDVETHLGAADLVIDLEDIETAKGEYWTRRNWRMGLNTAGRLELERVSAKKEKSKSLEQYMQAPGRT